MAAGRYSRTQGTVGLWSVASLSFKEIGSWHLRFSVDPAGQQTSLDDDDARLFLPTSFRSSAHVVSKVVKRYSPVADSWTQATLLYLPF
jgi:hypothetical protein